MRRGREGLTCGWHVAWSWCVTGNLISGDGIAALAPSLAGLSSLRTLDLSGEWCEMWGWMRRGREGLTCGWHVAWCWCVTTGNAISDAGMEALAPSLAGLSSLWTLDLSGEWCEM